MTDQPTVLAAPTPGQPGLPDTVFGQVLPYHEPHPAFATPALRPPRRRWWSLRRR